VWAPELSGCGELRLERESWGGEALGEEICHTGSSGDAQQKVFLPDP